MQQILNVLTPATSQDLVSLEDMKTKFFIPDTDTSKDALLQEIITNTSEQIALMCNRVFGYEAVEETFYQLEDGCFTQRLYLSRWPVALADITSLTQDGVDIAPWLSPIPGAITPAGTPPPTCVLEQDTGTLYMPSFLGTWGGVIDVEYSGGYKLPDGAPGSLKFAAEAVIRESYTSWLRDPALFGVRQISHKESRIGYYGPNMFPTTGLPETWKNVGSVLNKFIRHWV
jgi:hypothetical protein